MRQVYLLVEGQTEEAFVNELLEPHYSRMNLFFTPVIVKTSPGHKGGVTTYAKIKPQLQRLCNNKNATVSTLFDLYALPGDFAGKSRPDYQQKAGGHAKALFLEEEWSKDMRQANFIPNILVYEFEALLFSNVDAFAQWTDDDGMLDSLHHVRKTIEPEDINDHPKTAPSKRILQAWRGYQKTFHGPLIACDIGLDTIRSKCPHFNGWLQKIEKLIP